MKKILIATIAIFSLFTVFTAEARANHSWGGYHWGRTENPFTLFAADNLSADWQPYLQTTLSDWSQSSVLDMESVSGSNRKNCKPTPGRDEVCNSKYGNNGWLGLAQIWISDGHITAGVTKLNDTYFNRPQYNTAAWRNLVTCQEIGHTLGLDHQDEDFDNVNLGTCMDYTSDPTTNQQPNNHDYEELEAIYGHTDSINTVDSFLQSVRLGHYAVDFDNPSQWGQLAKESRGTAIYERDFGNGQKLVTFIIKPL